MRAKKSDTSADSLILAKMMCGSLSAIAITLTNEPQAAMSENEQQMIVPALAETLKNLSEDAQERLNKYANPFIVLTGLAMWGLRISQYVHPPKPVQKNPTGKPPVVVEVKPDVSGGNGQEGFPSSNLQAVMNGGG